MTIYLDIVFIENIIMNIIIVYGTGLILKTRLKIPRIFLSSFLGTIYLMLEYIKLFPSNITVFMKIAVSIMMVYIAFYPQNVKEMLKSILLFYLVTFTTGGCAFGILYLINPSAILIRNGIVLLRNPLKVSLISGVLGFVIIQYSFYYNKRKLKKEDMICNIKIKLYGKQIKAKAFIDSGNNLKEPITNTPVIILEQGLLNNIVDIEQIIMQGGDELKIRWIPYNSIGKSNGVLMGIQAEYVKIEYDGDKTTVNNVIIGIYNKKINKKYSALLGLNLFEGENKNEYNVNTEKNIFQHN